uniref:Uncharacterized protein n=1 Tax=Alexandrium monilatum TaxID=311494 RepID=A0A7S4QVH1_9DINO
MDNYPPLQCIGGGANLRAVGAQFMMSSPGAPGFAPGARGSHIAHRLEQLEHELMQLKSMRGQEEAPQYPPGPVLPDSGFMGMPPFSHNQSAHSAGAAGQPQTMCIPVPYPVHHQMPGTVATGPSTKEHDELLHAHRELLDSMQQQQMRHTQLLQSHTDLMKAHMDLLSKTLGQGSGTDKKKKLKNHPCLGVVRLDYNYPPAGGDTDCPASFAYDVFYRAVPGLTFELAQAGHFDETVERHFAEAIKHLEQRQVHAITGDCGFMMAFQVLARKIATKPVFMSSMVQCPAIAAAFRASDKLLILTANGESLKPQKEVLLHSCGFDVSEDRFIIKGCQDVPGFDAVAKGEAVPLDIVQPGIVKLTKDFLKAHPDIKGILLECTELPPYADALRAHTGLPVWDCITGADFYINAFKDNPRFGINDWQAEWDQEQEDYTFGQNLIEKDRSQLLNLKRDDTDKAKKKKHSRARALAHPTTKAKLEKTKRILQRKQSPILGVVRLDYNYPPAKGDIDCPGSYDYEVLFRCVPGLTFEMAQVGRMTHTVQQEFVKAIKWLEARGVSGITGDCGFMMAFQPIASEVASVPVFMSSMVQSPMVSVAFDKYDKILILTANSKTLKPQKDTLLKHCGFDVDDSRFVIYGCEDVPGFDAVSKGDKVDVEYVTPGMVKMVTDILEKEPTIRAILLECTELPPYSDALRHSTDLPVFDAITCADFYICARKDNPRFGLNQWQCDWDGVADEYELGDNLDSASTKFLVNG